MPQSSPKAGPATYKTGSVGPKRDLQMKYNDSERERKPLHPPPRPEEKESAIAEKSVSPKRDSVAQNKKTKSNQAALEEERNTPPLANIIINDEYTISMT
ncbi:hypothetical protein CBL_05204 [Carabus blaptoides fortunei]